MRLGKQKRNSSPSQNGNVTVMASVLIMGLVGVKVVSDKQVVNVRKAKDIGYEKARTNAENSNYSAVSAVANLFKYSHGHPTLYAENYKANQWRLKTGPAFNNKFVELVSDRQIKVHLPDTRSKNFYKIHELNGSEPALKPTIIDILGVKTSSDAPHVEKKNMFLEIKSTFEDSRIESNTQIDQKIKAVIDLTPPPQPQIIITSTGISTAGLESLNNGASIGKMFAFAQNSGQNLHLKNHTYLFTTHTGQTTVPLSIHINGIASSGRYNLGGSGWVDLKLDQTPMNYKTTINAANIKFTVSGNAIESSGCEWTTTSDDPYKKVSKASFQQFTEQEQKDAYYERQIEDLGQKKSAANAALPPARNLLSNAISQAAGPTNSARAKFKNAGNSIRNTANSLVNASNTGPFDQAIQSMQRTLNQNQSENETITTRVRKCGPFGFWCWYTTETRTVTHYIPGNLNNALNDIINKSRNLKNTLNSANNTQSAIDAINQKYQTDGSYDISTKTVKITEEAFSLEVVIFDVKGKEIRKDIVFTIDAKAYNNCNCSSLNLFDYSNKSGKAKVLGDGGYVCSDKDDTFDVTLFVVNGRSPRCKATQVQINRGKCGCFGEDTLITMADGTQKPIGKIQSGEMVLNPITGKGVEVLYTIKGPENKPLLEITSSNNQSVKVTSEHPFLTPYGYKQARFLKENDQIISSEDKVLSISSIKLLPAQPPYPIVWNIMLDGNQEDEKHMLIGNGIPSGDLFIQNKLKKMLSKKESLMGSTVKIDDHKPMENR